MRSLLASLLSIFALGSSAAAQQNVLFVLIDDIGVDMLGCYAEGSNTATTPVMDNLAQGGVMFRNAYSTPCCSPTRATILTGRYGFRTGIGFVVSKNGYDLQENELVLPEVFSDNGFANGGFGKWHLSNRVDASCQTHPNTSGFDHWVGTVQNLVQPQSFNWYVESHNGVLQHSDTYATTAAVNQFLAWESQQTGPWFAYVAFHAAHEPWHEPPAHLHTETLPDADPRFRPKPFYRATIEAMDTEIGRMLSSLDPATLANTNIVVLGDNGTPRQVVIDPFTPEHAKLTPYEGGINVPLIVSGPIVEQGGREVEALVNTTDMFTTSLELGGIDTTQALPSNLVHDSVSIVPYLQDPATTPLRTYAYTELFKPNGFGNNKTLDRRIIRDDRYKVIRSGVDPANHTFEFFDLQQDPFELADLLDQPGGLTAKQQQRFTTLKSKIERLLSNP